LASGLCILRGGTAGNARLTALTGLVIFILLAAEGVTVPAVQSLIVPHAFIGFLLIPPIALKLASTGYRFASYYLGAAQYRTAGPPRPIPRLLAPFLVLSTVTLFGTGVLLIRGPPGHDSVWRCLHTISFCVSFGVMTARVLTYLWRALSLAGAELHTPRRRPVAGLLERDVLVVGSVLAGIVLALVFLPWDTTWAHWLSTFHGDH